MSRICQILGKRVRTGNNVPKSNQRTKRVFMPNLQSMKIFSSSLGKDVDLRISTKGIKTLEKYEYNFDAWIVCSKSNNLVDKMKIFRKRVLKKLTKENILDLYRKNIEKLDSEEKKSLAFSLIRRAMIRKMPYSRFNLNWDKIVQLRDEEYSYEKYKRRRAYHNQSFKFHFFEFSIV